MHPARLEHLALLAIASSLTAIWLDLWVAWSLGAWAAGAAVPRFWPVGLALAGLAAAWFTGKSLQQRRLRQRAARAALAGAGALTVLLLTGWAVGGRISAGSLQSGPRLAELFPTGGPAFLAAMLGWWQGERLGRTPVGNWALRSTYYSGVIALALLLILNSLVTVLPAGQVLGALLLFFALALSGLALTSLRHLHQQQRAGGLTVLPISRQWLLTSSAVIGLLLGGELLAARVVAAKALQQLAGSLWAQVDGLGYSLALLLLPLAAWLDRLLSPALLGLSRFLETFIATLGEVLGRLQELVAILVSLMSVYVPRFANVRRLQALLASPAVQVSARWAGLLALLIIVAIVFWFTARRLWGLETADEDELRESVLTGHLLLAQLKNLLKRRRRRPPARTPAYLALSGAPDDARVIIRRAYQAMLEWAPALSLPRRLAGQTPVAYAATLRRALPEGHAAIDVLTGAYVQARYAAEAPSLATAQSAEGAVIQLRSLPANLLRTNRPVTQH